MPPTPDTLLCTTYLVHQAETELDQARMTQRCHHITTQEQAWDLVVSLVDRVPIDTPSLAAHVHQQEQRYFQGQLAPDVQEVPVPVDANTLLDIRTKIGLICPECRAQETSYKLYANRSADEGMTAYCSCRTCLHQWRIKM
jgi:DNA-directed RNA polymerase subunit M/transcription elongation factor TFIIS